MIVLPRYEAFAVFVKNENQTTYLFGSQSQVDLGKYCPEIIGLHLIFVAKVSNPEDAFRGNAKFLAALQKQVHNGCFTL